MLNVERTLSPGTVIHGRYRIEKVLGAGGFGVTYQVRDLKEGRLAAMKEYMPADFAYRRARSNTVIPNSNQETAYEKFLDKFQKEAQTIYRFRGHPNIVEVRHLFRENNTAYYVMELLDGEDLCKFLQRRGGRVTWQWLRPIMAQVVTALNTIHGAGLIHCDISPDNICILNSGEPKLLDFGASRVLLHGEAVASVIVLKNGYAPPEQRFGRKMGTWTDVYALAVTIYRCTTGIVPPAAEERLTGAAVQQPSKLGIAVPSGEWEQVLMKAMALHIEERYQTVSEFWQALEQAAPNTGEQGTKEGIWITCNHGIHSGMRHYITEETLLGVDSHRCAIVYPPGTPGVSRVHLRFWPGGHRLMVMDMGSTYGSWLNGKPMTPGLVYTVNPGDHIRFGSGEEYVQSYQADMDTGVHFTTL